MAIDTLYASDDFTGDAGPLDDRTFTTGGVNFKWVKANPGMTWLDSLYLTGSGTLTHTNTAGNADGYVLSLASTSAVIPLTRPFRVEMDVTSAESSNLTIAVGDYNYSLFNLNGQYLRLGSRPQPITSGTSPGADSFPSPPVPAYGTHTLSYEVDDAGIVTYKIDSTLLGSYSYHTPYDPCHLIIALYGAGFISAVRVYVEGAVTPPPELPPLIYEEGFNGYDLTNMYSGTLEFSCIGAYAASFEPAPYPLRDSYITNRTDPRVQRNAVSFEAAAAGSGDRFFVPFNELQRPITHESVCAQALVSVSSGTDSVTFGWLDTSDKTRIAAGVRLYVENGFVVIETFAYVGGVRVAEIATVGGEPVSLTNLLPGEYWLRCVRNPWSSEFSNLELSLDMSLRAGGTPVGGIGTKVINLYVNEPVVELSGDGRLHYIYVGTDFPDFTTDVALLGDGRFWASLVNTSEEI